MYMCVCVRVLLVYVFVREEQELAECVFRAAVFQCSSVAEQKHMNSLFVWMQTVFFSAHCFIQDAGSYIICYFRLHLNPLQHFSPAKCNVDRC